MKNKTKVSSWFGIGILGLAAVCFASTASAQNPRLYPPLHNSAYPDKEALAANGTGKLSADDQKFMQEAAKGGMMEVEWGKLAAQDGKHPDVKKFGNRMVTDHSKANKELTTLAASKGVRLPASKSGGKWKNDKDYMEMMVKDHEGDLAAFQAEAKNGSDPDVKKFASKGATMVQSHLAMAKGIQGKLN